MQLKMKSSRLSNKYKCYYQVYSQSKFVLKTGENARNFHCLKRVTSYTEWRRRILEEGCALTIFGVYILAEKYSYSSR